MSARSHTAVAVAIAAILLGVAARAAAQPSSPAAVTPKTGLSIGVAPFERVGDVGAEVPDVALMLARRLSTLGVQQVASPSDIGGAPMADPEARTAAEQAARSSVAALVVGRATAIGGKLSIDARLRDGRTGEPVGRRFFVEVAKPRELAAGIEQLAAQVVEQANEASPAGTPAAPAPVAAAPRPEAAAAPSGAPEARAAGNRTAGFDSNAPITIKSDVLDVLEQSGKRRFLFAGNVRAKQADLVIRSEKLEAFYPEGGSQPEKIVASGSVSMKQAGRTARCSQATFYRKDDRIVCVGDVAEVVQGCDVVRGREIVFHTASQVLKVNGAADVRINPEAAGCKGASGGTGQ